MRHIYYQFHIDKYTGIRGLIHFMPAKFVLTVIGKSSFCWIILHAFGGYGWLYFTSDRA